MIYNISTHLKSCSSITESQTILENKVTRLSVETLADIRLIVYVLQIF